MAVRTTRQVTTPRYCAEHRHDINGFEKATQHLGRIDDYQDWLDYERPNLSKAAKVVLFAGVAASLITPAAIANAPAIGAMLGSSALGGGLTGVAATSHGLAMLGGGAVGSGLFGMGAGMAGGVAVVAVVGSGLSGTLGAVTANAYYGDDKSFRIQQVRDGTGAPILTATGFLTEGDDSGWGPWQQLVDEMYPDRPVYRVHWGSKELAAFAVLGGRGVVARATAARAAQWAARGSKSAAKKVPFIGSALIARDIAANPWSVAHNRAQMTGTLLAAILSRVETDQFVLIGHSLGALVMATAAQSLAGSAPQPRLESVHLLGAAIPAKGDWNMLNNSVTGKVYNYRSARDPVLKHAYRGAQLGRVAAGVTGFDTNLPNIVNVDLSSKVASHSAYFTQAHLRGPGSTQRA
jgi:hypothetical protein